MAWERGGCSRTSTAAHRRWARQVKARDGYRCQRCGYQGSATAQPHDIEANHIVNTRSGGTDTLSNGEALCLPCHATETQREAQAGRAKNGRLRPAEPHPGRR